MSIAFAVSEFGTLGVEYEVEILDQSSKLPVPFAPELAAVVQPSLARGSVSPDLFASTFEFRTAVCTSIEEAATDFSSIFQALAPELKSRNLALLGMGLHPLAHVSNYVVANDDRYRDIMERIAWPARRVPTNSLQMHIGMESGDQALRTAHALRPLLPFLLSLSASSPFRHGCRSGLASTRAALFSSVPRSGPMPPFENWEAYSSYCSSMIRSDAMPSELHTWWDCRLQPALGTLEIRIAESIANFEDILSLVALAWCMAVGIDHLQDFRISPELSNENRWRAIRYGTSKPMIVTDDGETESLSTIVYRLLELLDPTAESLGCHAHLERCLAMSVGDAHHQLITRHNSGVSEYELADQAADAMQVNW